MVARVDKFIQRTATVKSLCRCVTDFQAFSDYNMAACTLGRVCAGLPLPHKMVYCNNPYTVLILTPVNSGPLLGTLIVEY